MDLATGHTPDGAPRVSLSPNPRTSSRREPATAASASPLPRLYCLRARPASTAEIPAQASGPVRGAPISSASPVSANLRAVRQLTAKAAAKVAAVAVGKPPHKPCHYPPHTLIHILSLTLS